MLEKIHPIRGGEAGAPFTVLQVAATAGPNSNKRIGVTYITNGMSQQPQPCQDDWVCLPSVNVEIMIYSRRQTPLACKILEELANFPFDAKSCLARGQVLPTDDVNDLGWTGYALLSPLREDADFSPLPFKIGDNDVHVLWVFPLLPVELEFGMRFGGAAFEEIVAQQTFKPYLDTKRKPLISREELEEMDRKERASRKLKPVSVRQPAVKDAAKGEKSPRKLFGLANIFHRDKQEKPAQEKPAPEKAAAEKPTQVKPAAAQSTPTVVPLPTPGSGAAHGPRAQPVAKATGRITAPQSPTSAPSATESADAVRAKLEAARTREAETRERVRLLEGEINAVKESLRSVRDDTHKSEQSREARLGRKRELDEVVTRISSELAAENAAIALATKELEAARVAMKGVAADLDKQKVSKGEIGQKRDAIIEELKAMSARASTVSERHSSMEQAARDARATAETLEAKAADLKRQAEEAAEAARKARASAEEADREARKETGEGKRLADLDETLRKKLGRIEEELKVASGKFAEKEKTLQAAGATVSALEKTSMPDTSRRDGLDKELAAVRKDVAQVDHEIEAADDQLRAQRSLKSTGVVTEQRLDRQIKEAIEAAASASEELERLEKMYERMEVAEYERAQAEANAAAAKVAEMQAALERAKLDAAQKLKEIEGRSRTYGKSIPQSEPEPAPAAPVAESTAKTIVMPTPQGPANPVQKDKRATARHDRLQIIKQSMLKDKEEGK